MPVPEGMGTQGGTLGQCLLKTIQLLGKTVPNDTLSQLLDHGLHHPVPPPSLKMVLRASPVCGSELDPATAFHGTKKPPWGYGCSLHPSGDMGSGAFLTPSEGQSEAGRRLAGPAGSHCPSAVGLRGA